MREHDFKWTLSFLESEEKNGKLFLLQRDLDALHLQNSKGETICENSNEPLGRFGRKWRFIMVGTFCSWHCCKPLGSVGTKTFVFCRYLHVFMKLGSSLNYKIASTSMSDMSRWDSWRHLLTIDGTDKKFWHFWIILKQNSGSKSNRVLGFAIEKFRFSKHSMNDFVWVQGIVWMVKKIFWRNVQLGCQIAWM